MNKAIIIIIIFTAGFAFSQEIRQPIAPTPPSPPAQPIAPSTAEREQNFPSLPNLPSFHNNNQTNRPEQESSRYVLNVSGAFPNGDTRNNVANTINNAQYILYSNGTAALTLFFRNSPEYIYHLSNPRSRIEVSAGVFRETYDTTVQVGREFLLEQYTSELSYDNNTILSFNLIGSNRVIVLINFSR